MNPNEIKQGTPEWFEIRRGKITGSRFKDVLSKEDGETYKKYMRELLYERKTEVECGSYYDKNMEAGQHYEPQARKYYQQLHPKLTVKEVGFIEHPLEQYRGYVGVSPDGFVDRDGQLEIKCPLPKTHISYMAQGKLPNTYKPQVQGSLWVTGRKWCDFISFNPTVTKEPFWCIRIERDEDYIKELAVAVDKFIQELIEMEKTSTTGIDPAILLKRTGGCSDEEWKKHLEEVDEKLQQIVDGKIRTHIVCAMIQSSGFACNDEQKEHVNRIVEFIVTGK